MTNFTVLYMSSHGKSMIALERPLPTCGSCLGRLMMWNLVSQRQLQKILDGELLSFSVFLLLFLHFFRLRWRQTRFLQEVCVSGPLYSVP